MAIEYEMEFCSMQNDNGPGMGGIPGVPGRAEVASPPYTWLHGPFNKNHSTQGIKINDNIESG